MKNFSPIYDFLTSLIPEFRVEIQVTVKGLCDSSGVSSRTYAKLVKRNQVKPECYAKLVIGFCGVATLEEFMKFWTRLGQWIYGEYRER